MTTSGEPRIVIPQAPLTSAFAGSRKAYTKVQEIQQKVMPKIAEHRDMLITKANEFAQWLWVALGVSLILHGTHFKNLFLCAQVIHTFCYGRINATIIAMKAGWEKKDDDEKKEADAKAEAAPTSSNKHAKKREKSSNVQEEQFNMEAEAAAAKEALKSVDSKKVSDVFVQVCVAFGACHMVMEGGLGTVVVVTHGLVQACKVKIADMLVYEENEDMKDWADLVLSFVLYAFFGILAVIASPFALALNVCMTGAQLVTAHGLRFAEGKKKIASAEEAIKGTQGLAMLGGFTLFGLLYQWVMGGVGWYFAYTIYLPAFIAESLVGFL